MLGVEIDTIVVIILESVKEKCDKKDSYTV